MAKCMDMWADKTASVEAPLGPYLCGRKLAHSGQHAFQGADGAFAAWTPQGELLLSVQTAKPAGKPEELEELVGEWQIDG